VSETANLSSLRKAVIPAGGFGTRFLPVSKSVPKEMLPILGRPVIDFVVAEAVAAGCSDICIVLTSGKESIRRYFESAPNLEARLGANGKNRELDLVRGTNSGATIEFVDQGEPLGLGHAILAAREFTADEPFLVLLGDTILDPPASRDLVGFHRQTAMSSVSVEDVEESLVSRYGIVGPDAASHPDEVNPRNAVRGTDEPFRLSSLVEKPSPETAPSLWAVAARYVFTPALWRHLERSDPAAGGEIDLTEAMDSLSRDARLGAGIYAVPIPGSRYDLGNPIDFLAAEIEIARRSLSDDVLNRLGL